MIEVSGAAPTAGPWSDGASVTFRVADPGNRLAGVRLSQDVRIPGELLDFQPASPDGRAAVAGC